MHLRFYLFLDVKRLFRELGVENVDQAREKIEELKKKSKLSENQKHYKVLMPQLVVIVGPSVMYTGYINLPYLSACSYSHAC